MHKDMKILRICIIGAGLRASLFWAWAFRWLTRFTGMGGLACALALAKAGFEDIEVYEYASNLGFVGAGI
jgi:hypothetical protein